MSVPKRIAWNIDATVHMAMEFNGRPYFNLHQQVARMGWERWR